MYFAGHILEALLVASTAAIIVTYNSADVLASCLAALKTHAPDVPAVVIDNASTDNSVEIARRAGAEVIANSENRGFAGAVNQGFRATHAERVLILNPDVSLTSGLAPLETATTQYGLAGGKLTDGQGQVQAGFTIRRFPTPTVLGLELLGLNRLWPSNSANQSYRYVGRDLTRSGPADQPAGAFLMVRRDVWERLNGMDESFWPIWFEDVDFCRRAAVLGFQPYYEPASSACHLGGHSIKKIDGASKQVFWYDSVLRYAGKHFSGGQYRWTCVMALLGAGPRAFLGFLQDRSFLVVGKYLKILNFVGRRLVSRPPSGLAQRPGSEY